MLAAYYYTIHPEMIARNARAYCSIAASTSDLSLVTLLTHVSTPFDLSLGLFGSYILIVFTRMTTVAGSDYSPGYTSTTSPLSSNIRTLASDHNQPERFRMIHEHCQLAVDQLRRYLGACSSVMIHHSVIRTPPALPNLCPVVSSPPRGQ